jgi:hypothetical protein
MTSLLVTFSRRVDQPFEHSLEAVARWRPQVERGVSMGCATIDARSDDAPDLFRLELHFQTRGRRSLPMELRLTPWSDTDTHVELLPLRAVRGSRRYFRQSRLVLNDVVGAIAPRLSIPGELASSAPPTYLSRSA